MQEKRGGISITDKHSDLTKEEEVSEG
jgi:hypothetical protein